MQFISVDLPTFHRGNYQVVFSFKHYSNCHAEDRHLSETSKVVRLMFDSYAHVVQQRDYVLKKKKKKSSENCKLKWSCWGPTLRHWGSMPFSDSITKITKMPMFIFKGSVRRTSTHSMAVIWTACLPARAMVFYSEASPLSTSRSHKPPLLWK